MPTTIYTDYRKIWIDRFGPIPKDKDNRSYDIHHIDGDKTNNDISNLKCITIQEHYNIHYNQKDYGACYYIMLRMDKSPEELSEIARKSLANRKNPFSTREDGSSIASDRVKNGTNPFLKQEDGSSMAKIWHKKRLEAGTHIFQKRNPNKIILTCPHCNKTGSKPGMIRYHFDNCKFM